MWPFKKKESLNKRNGFLGIRQPDPANDYFIANLYDSSFFNVDDMSRSSSGFSSGSDHGCSSSSGFSSGSDHGCSSSSDGGSCCGAD